MTTIKITQHNLLIASLLTVLALMLAAVAGYRPFGVGLDFGQYLFFYADIRAHEEFSYFRFEPGFVLSAYIAKFWLGVDYMTFAFVISAISLMIKFHVFRQFEYPLLAIFYYIAVWFPLLENTQLRVAIAISILFLATRFLFSRRWVMFLVLSVLAFQFHMSAIAGAVMLAFAYYLSSFRLLIGIAVSVFLTLVISTASSTLFLFGLGLNGTIGNISDSATVNIFSPVTVANFLFLVATKFSGSLTTQRSKTFFLMGCFSFAFLIGFQSFPVMSNRFREIIAVFMVFIAFEYKITLRTLPQATIATLQIFMMSYLYISGGFFSD